MKLTPDQVKVYLSDKRIKATVTKNKVLAVREREGNLMLLGYNQALLDHGVPEGVSRQSLVDAVESLKRKAGGC
jgi:hypothetical protein